MQAILSAPMCAMRLSNNMSIWERCGSRRLCIPYSCQFSRPPSPAQPTSCPRPLRCPHPHALWAEVFGLASACFKTARACWSYDLHDPSLYDSLWMGPPAPDVLKGALTPIVGGANATAGTTGRRASSAASVGRGCRARSSMLPKWLQQWSAAQ